MNENPLLQVKHLGQSIWLDFVHREQIRNGEFERLIHEDGVSGFTSNPKIFDKAIGDSDVYDEDIRAMAEEGMKVDAIYEALAVQDIQAVADLLRSEYDRVDGRDGFVSLEVNPHLAHDTKGTVAEVRRLWNSVNRPNVLIKIPGTREGLPAIRQCLAEGINVNVTLLFGLPHYRKVANAYVEALEERVNRKTPLDRIASVASFFLSRIDVLVDPQLEAINKGDDERSERARDLHGEVAIASARQAYQIYKEIFGNERFSRLADHGARPQRVLWASTSTKDPEYSDVRYVEALIGPDTVNTMPPDTLDAYRDHGCPELRLESDVGESRRMLERLQDVGIDLNSMTQQLEDDGVAKFKEPYDDLLKDLTHKSNAVIESA